MITTIIIFIILASLEVLACGVVADLECHFTSEVLGVLAVSHAVIAVALTIYYLIK